jgi:nucleotide-binding universal stress UspA family protein
MFERILVLLDGSPTGEACLPYLGKLSRWGPPHAVLTRVLDPRLLEGGPAEEEREIAFARAYLDQIVTVLRAMKIPSTTITRVGPVAETLLAMTGSSTASLVAISTHGRLTPAEVPYGTVAAQIFRSCPLPILAVPLGARDASVGKPVGVEPPFRNILVASGGDLRDGPDVSIPAELAAQSGAEVLLVRMAPPERTGRGEAEERSAAEEYLDRSGPFFERQRVSTDRVVEQGDPAKAILDLALRRRVDLIALGQEAAFGEARERAAFHSLLRWATVPLLLFRSESRASAHGPPERAAMKDEAP